MAEQEPILVTGAVGQLGAVGGTVTYSSKAVPGNDEWLGSTAARNGVTVAGAPVRTASASCARHGIVPMQVRVRPPELVENYEQ